MSGPILGDLSNNRWSGGTSEEFSEYSGFILLAVCNVQLSVRLVAIRYLVRCDVLRAPVVCDVLARELAEGGVHDWRADSVEPSAAIGLPGGGERGPWRNIKLEHQSRFNLGPTAWRIEQS
jgi:hypothetical protein